MRNLSLAFAFAVLAFGCGPDKINHKVRFYGHVEDKFTRYPVAYAGISIYMYHGSFAGSTLTRIYDDLGTTDANGDYDFKMKKLIKDKDSYSQYMRFSGRGFNNSQYSDQWPFGDYDDRENHIDVQLYTLCRWRITFTNSTPFDANDLVSNIYIDRPWGQQKLEEGDPQIAGPAVNSNIWTTYYGYTTSILHYTVTKNSVSQNYTDTLNVVDPFGGIVFSDTILY